MLQFYELLVGFRLRYPLADHIVSVAGSFLRVTFNAFPLQFRAEHFFHCKYWK